MILKNLYLSVCLSACFSGAWAQNADSILSRHIEVMGGLKNWNRVKSLKITGSPNGGGVSYKQTQIIADGKAIRTDMFFHGQDNFSVGTPEGGWNYRVSYPKGAPMKISPIPASQLKAVLPKLHIKRDLVLDRTAIIKSEFKGVEHINKKPCYALKITDIDNNVETAYFEVATGFMLREVKQSGQDDQSAETNLDYSNFQKQPSGIVYPMTLRTVQGEFVISSLEVNVPVDDSLINTHHGTVVPKNDNR